MDALLAAYDSNDDDDDERISGGGGDGGGDEEEDPDSATAKRAREDGADDVDAGATDGSGRVERFHVDGNFPRTSTCP